jgi:hypothetical protein
MSLPNLLPGGSADARPATFAEAFARIAVDGAATPDRLAEYRSAIAALERVTGQSADRLPMAPRALRPFLEAVLPARHRMSRKRWANIRSSLTSIAALTGHVSAGADLRVPLQGAWASAMAMLSDKSHFSRPTASAPDRDSSEDHKITSDKPPPLSSSPHIAALNGFARFCQANAIGPEAVDEAALEVYRAFLIDCTYKLAPGASTSAIRPLWNKAARTVHGWPV